MKHTYLALALISMHAFGVNQEQEEKKLNGWSSEPERLSVDGDVNRSKFDQERQSTTASTNYEEFLRAFEKL